MDLDQGWEAAPAAPDSDAGPGDLDSLTWLPARVPGTAAAALRDAGAWRTGDERDLDAEDWWFRTRFAAEPPEAGEEVVLHLDGIATVSEVFLNGESVLQSESMFAAHAVDIGARLTGDNELAIRCRALGPLLAGRRKPRARWRTQLVAEGNLRFFRTALLGRAPGFAPGPAPVGPWRPVRLERRQGLVADALELRPSLAGDDGVLAVRARLRGIGEPAPAAAEVELSGPSGTHRAPLGVTPDGDDAVAEGKLTVPAVARWWPHTHGDPVLYAVRLLAGERTVAAGRVGFRSLAAGPGTGHDVETDGLDLHVNGVRVFARGAVWTPPDPVGLAPSAAELRSTLECARDAGMNMLRVPGIGAYESATFHDLCDELGLLVWQDFMFANLDYPIADEAFRATVEAEARAVLAGLAGRPSLAVLCGNSEVEQQVAMLGLAPKLGRGPLFGEVLPAALAESGADAAWVPSAPCGGDLPFRTNRGIANYYGVGAYLRPLEDARRAGIRFAAECLAFANVPDEAEADRTGVPRDAGADWDFADVRDHYLALLFGVDPAELRESDPERYLELSRATTGEVMAEIFGEWRRAASPSGGGLVLWWRDLVPGAGWGLTDHAGRPKVAYHHLRRALAPAAVWLSDEGLGGIVAHVANDGPEPLSARLRVALYRDLEHRVDEAQEPLELGPHDAAERNVEALLGRFVDVTWAYRFGPPAQDLVVASLEREGPGGTTLLSQAMRFPVGRPAAVESAESLGLEARARALDDGDIDLSVRSRRLAYGVRVHAQGFDAGDDAFSVEPGGERLVRLRRQEPGAASFEGAVSALNLEAPLAVSLEGVAT